MALRLLPPLLLVLLLAAAGDVVSSDLAQDRAALLAFFDATPHEDRVRWDANASACDWIGVTCDANRTAVLALRLPAVGLLGSIPAGTIGRLSSLRVLSLRSNGLSGPIPADFAGLTRLRGLYLQDNRFSGEIPPDFAKMTRLMHLDLSGNDLTGGIPFALNDLTRLTHLLLQRNRLSGTLPSIVIAPLELFNVSGNLLSGSIPESLRRFPLSSFARNLNLCDGPLVPCSPFFPSPALSLPLLVKKRKFPKAAIIEITAGAGVALLLALLLLRWAFRLSRLVDDETTATLSRITGGASTSRTPSAGRSGRLTGGASTNGTPSTGRSGRLAGSAIIRDAPSAETGDRRAQLVFLGRGKGRCCFNLDDLLQARAECIGNGSTGTFYRVTLRDDAILAVKKLKDVTASRREFEAQMEMLGQVTPMANLLPPQAYGQSANESIKFLVFDFVSTGDLSFLLHARRGTGRAPIQWKMRKHIAVAAGRGLCHLHTKAGMVHGNVKASNVILVPGIDVAVLCDFGLHGLFNPRGLPARTAGYCAPEVRETGKPTFESDVYSFGVLLLELLSGKSPASAEGIDLPRWVQSVVREEWTTEVFDADLFLDQNAEEEMVQLLEIALACIATVPDARPDISDVVRMLEEIGERSSDSGEASCEQDADSVTQSTTPQQQGQRLPPPPPPPPPPLPRRESSISTDTP